MGQLLSTVSVVGLLVPAQLVFSLGQWLLPAECLVTGNIPFVPLQLVFQIGALPSSGGLVGLGLGSLRC